MMTEINLYIYNDIDQSLWEDEFCGKCGAKIAEVKGEVVRRVHSENAPANVFRADTAYIRVMCRHCKTRTNILIHSFSYSPGQPRVL